MIAVAAIAVAAPVQADLCTIEATPAAMLLLPYFEVDISNTNGVDTFLSINNASNESVLTHVEVWTDMSVEALDFDIYLTGYDTQSIGMGLIIRDGILPRTAPTSSVSPRGPWSGPHPAYPGCDALPYTNPVLDADFLDHLQSILTGGASSIYGGLCGGFDHGDNIARGYVSIGVVNDCTLLTPCDVGYFYLGVDGDLIPGGVGAHDNVLWGDWYMIDYANNFAQGDTLVHVEADTTFDPFGALQSGSFWNRCTPIFASPFPDFREPLPTTFATRFYQNAAFSGGTDFLVWRDSLYLPQDGFSCSSGPFWYPISQRQAVFFDEQENPEALCTISPCPEQDILFPLEAQRVSVSDIDITPDSGWAYFNLNQDPAVFGTFSDIPQAVAAGAWVTAVHSAEGRFSAGLPAIQLDSFCDNASIVLGPSGPEFPAGDIVYNYFNSYYYYPGGQPPVARPNPDAVARGWRQQQQP
jgi:hypothetical protein